MHRHKRRDRPLATPARQLSRSPVEEALIFKIFLQPDGTHRMRALFYINKFRTSTRLTYGLRRCDERIRNGYDRITLAHPTGHERETQGVCAAAVTNAVASIANLGELRFETLYHCTANELGCLPNVPTHGHQIV